MKGKKTGGRDFVKGQVANPSGMTKEQRSDATEFREWAFAFFKKNRANFEDLIISDQVTASKFISTLAGMCPKETVVSGIGDGGAIIINYPPDFRG